MDKMKTQLFLLTSALLACTGLATDPYGKKKQMMMKMNMNMKKPNSKKSDDGTTDLASLYVFHVADKKQKFTTYTNTGDKFKQDLEGVIESLSAGGGGLGDTVQFVIFHSQE